MPNRLAKALIVLAAIGIALPALATGEIESLITDADRERLAQYDATLTEAVETARAGGSATDVAIMETAVAADALSFQDFDLTGDWQCRTTKLGGPAPLVVYGWFRCRVTDDGSGWRLEKLTGSQRTVGRFFTQSDTRLTYLGSFHVAGEGPKPYGSGPESDQAGYATRTGEQSWQIGLPAPYYESRFDLMQFRRD